MQGQSQTTPPPPSSSGGTLMTIGAMAGPLSLFATGVTGFYLTKQMSSLREEHKKLEETLLDLTDTILSQSDAYDHLSEIHGVVTRQGKILEQHHSLVARLEQEMRQLDKTVKGLASRLDMGRPRPRRAYEEDLDYGEYAYETEKPVLAQAPAPAVQRFKPPPVSRNLAPKPRASLRKPPPPVIETDEEDDLDSEEETDTKEKPHFTQAEADELDMLLDD